MKADVDWIHYQILNTKRSFIRGKEGTRSRRAVCDEESFSWSKRSP